MLRGKSAVARSSRRAYVPRKYFRAALHGLQQIPWQCRGSANGALSSERALDEALRSAAAFQERCRRQWLDALLISGTREVGHDKPNCLPTEGKPAAVLDAILTLRNLVSDEDNEGSLDSDRNDEVQPHSMTMSLFEQQQVSLHVMLQQWVVYCAFHCTHVEFSARQSLVASTLFISPLSMLSSSKLHQSTMSSLDVAIRRRGARAYVDLLVHHQLPLRKQAEWNVLCALFSPGKGNTGVRTTGGLPSTRVGRLPFICSNGMEPSWERSLAMLTWSMHFKKQDEFHIPSSAISTTLHQYVQKLDDRLQISPDDQACGAEERSVIRWLQCWWRAARDAEHRCPELASACSLGRTAFDTINVDGRKVTLALSNKEVSKDSSVYAELMLQGRWEEVLKHIETMISSVTPARPSIRENADNRCGGESHALTEVEGDVALMCDDSQESLRLCLGSNTTPSPSVGSDGFSTLFNNPRPIFVKKKLWARASSSRLEKMPSNLLRAPESLTEALLLQNPPTVGLRTRGASAEKGAPAREADSVARCNAAGSSFQQDPCGEQASTSHNVALVQLRRKLWILRQVPHHVPRSLVRFEGSGALMVPYLMRCPAKEVLPWFLLGRVVAAVSQGLGGEELKVELSNIRSQTLYTLFVARPQYSAFSEYCADILLNMGNLVVPPAVLRSAVRIILRPPTLQHFYDSLQGRDVVVEADCRRLLGVPPGAADTKSGRGFSHSLTPSCAALLNELRCDSTMRRVFFVDKAHSMRNYHVSAWVESCSKVETLPVLVDIIMQEVNTCGPPLLSPEAAAALLTAIVIPLVCANGEDAEQHKETLSQLCGGALHALGFVYFAVPAEKAFGAASYFKALYDEEYIIKDGIEWTSNWDGAESLLVGRSLRQATKYPTTTTESFFRVDQCADSLSASFRVPQLRMCLMKVDLLLAMQYFGSTSARRKEERRESSGSREAGSLEVVEKPAIVAHNLPLGAAAVYKPAGVNTTLHVGHPHLIQFLAQNLPWKGAGVPVLFQHGLVNRIDLGSSGLVLVTDTDAALMATRRASIVDRLVEKTYRVLLVHCPASKSRMESCESWYLSPKGIIMCDVFANGGDHSLQIAALDTTRGGALPATALDRRLATTAYRVLEYFSRSGVYYVEVQLHTGRRHQIRQHFAQLCHPLLGDGRYSKRAELVGKKFGLHRPALHAARITITPCSCNTSNRYGRDVSGLGESNSTGNEGYFDERWEKTVVECPLSEDMQSALKMLRQRENVPVLGCL